ncbi:MAG TPA: tetratricopeptide repeat protein, partial [Thiothrix sp.]|nr:tetratricopeptide repeat protein [Thiothrix sp.]
MGKAEKAVAAYRKALSAKRHKHGGDYKGIAIDLNNLAVALFALKKDKEAANYLQQAYKKIDSVDTAQANIIKKNIENYKVSVK